MTEERFDVASPHDAPRGPDHPWFDDSSRPIYYVRFPAEATDEEVEAYGQAFCAWRQGLTQRVGYVVELDQVLRVPSTQRRILAEWEQRAEEAARATTIVVGFVVRGREVQGLLTAVFWLSMPSYPYRVFRSAMDAHLFVSDTMDEARG